MRAARTHIMLCAGTGCVSNGAFKIKESLERELKKHDLENEVSVVMTGCNGFCAQGPVMTVHPEGIFYQLLTEEDIPHLVEEHFLKGRPVERLMYTPPAEKAPVPKMSEIGFFKKQRLIALRNRGLIDPEKIDEAIARGGYRALAKALTSMNSEEIIKEIKPSELEESQILVFAKETVEKINKVLKEANICAVAELHGSVAHGTWIKGQQELDVFIVIENYVKRKQLQRVLELMRDKTEWVYTEAYAEHPYLKTEINGYNLDIVPCFRVKGGEELHSSTDRTPLHTKWLRERIEGLEDEVRLLKKFLLNLDLYGAEIRIGGFSGYLCEILIVYYGGFWELIKAASTWGEKEIMSFYSGEYREFADSLVFIDPVDSNRNVASALRENSYSIFISASRSFIKNPNMIFFKHEKQDVSTEVLIEELRGRPTDILFLVIEENKADVADVLWGQIHKSRQALERQFTDKGFIVLRSIAWSNEETRHIFIYELESGTISGAVKHGGPPANLNDNVSQFIEVYKDNPRTIAGPELVGDRWYVLVKRDYTEIRELLSNLLSDDGLNIGVSRKLGVRILQHHRVLMNEEIEDYLIDGFGVYLYDWLKGRPYWIE